MTASYALIYARDPQRAIGRGGAVPWRAPGDMRWFRLHTLGKLCIVGAGTAASLPPLPGRTLIVVGTRTPPATAPETQVWVRNLQSALHVAGLRVGTFGAHPEVMVIGGERLYRSFLGEYGGQVRRAYETEIGTEVEGADRWVPELPGAWRCLYEHRTRNARNELDGAAGWPVTYRVLERCF